MSLLNFEFEICQEPIPLGLAVRVTAERSGQSVVCKVQTACGRPCFAQVQRQYACYSTPAEPYALGNSTPGNSGLTASSHTRSSPVTIRKAEIEYATCLPVPIHRGCPPASDHLGRSNFSKDSSRRGLDDSHSHTNSGLTDTPLQPSSEYA